MLRTKAGLGGPTGRCIGCLGTFKGYTVTVGMSRIYIYIYIHNVDHIVPIKSHDGPQRIRHTLTKQLF